FRLGFTASHREREIDFTWRGTITGERDGTVTYALEGQALTTFLKNRIGFCVLHPDTCAGAPCRLTHADGKTEEATFPEPIAPQQPFLELRAISHEVAPGQWAELRMDGDIFETEDQRNWTDASFKTYCTPLRLGYPVEIAAGTRVGQTISLRVPGARGAARQATPPTYALDLGGPRRPLPALGLGVASHGQPLEPQELELLRALRPAHLRVDLWPGRAGWESALRQAAAEAAALSAGLEAALVLSDAAADELRAVAALPPSLPAPIARWLVFHESEPATSERLVALARTLLSPACPGATIAAGARAYFTELNRGPRPTFADEVVFSVNPQIHAFDDASLVETLHVQRVCAQNAARLSSGKPIVVSPVTLKPRFNAVATGPVPPPAPGELPDQVDPRQMSLYGAAWTLGSLANLAQSGAVSLTYYETTGWRGVLETSAGPPVPGRFAPLPGCAFPLYHPLADAGEMGGGRVVPGESSAPLRLEGLALESGGRLRTLLANVSDRPIEARLTGVPAAGVARLLDLSTVERACREPARFRAERGERVTSRAGEVRLELGPYATTCINWE
ncbi:MAG TPA: hypothetical protein VFG59_10200, partial [Anaeromyxobacter sp.]|nr:hypothetical protein [Anaeromyxobacter sp.]